MIVQKQVDTTNGAAIAQTSRPPQGRCHQAVTPRTNHTGDSLPSNTDAILVAPVRTREAPRCRIIPERHYLRHIATGGKRGRPRLFIDL
jgi:hypothetical protein